MAALREALAPNFDKSIDTAVLLAMTLEYGCDVEKLMELTGMPRLFVETVGKRMVANGIWIDGRPAFEKESFNDPKRFYVEFALHVLVADGVVVRVPA